MTAQETAGLPLGEGPKLNPFDFHGPQNIEFLEFLGRGTHSQVFKIKIQQKLFAIKVVSTAWLMNRA